MLNQISLFIVSGKETEMDSLHSPNEQLNAHSDLVMQTHLEIDDPHNRNTEDDDIGNEVGDAGPKPSIPRFCAVTKTRGPCCWQWFACSEIVSDRAY